MRRNLRYTAGELREQAARNGYRWKRPEETFQQGHGFCYDLSAVALALVEHAGIGSGYLLFVRWGHWGKARDSGHFVCVIEQSDYLMVLDNGRLTGPWCAETALVRSISRYRPSRVQRWQLDEIPWGLSYMDMTAFAR